MPVAEANSVNYEIRFYWAARRRKYRFLRFFRRIFFFFHFQRWRAWVFFEARRVAFSFAHVKNQE